MIPTTIEIKPVPHIIFQATSSWTEIATRIFNDIMFGITVLNVVNKRWPILINKLTYPKFITDSASLTASMSFSSNILKKLSLIIVARKIFSVIIHLIVYLAAPLSWFMTKCRNLNKQREVTIEDLQKHGFDVTRVTLQKSGNTYDAFQITHTNNKEGQWVQIAGGNAWIGEQLGPSILLILAKQYIPLNLNILYINGPGVGRSSGFPTSYSIAAAQEAGMQYLEVIGAQKILMHGISLGGGAQGEGIQLHDFTFAKQRNIKYMVWSDRTFSTLSSAAHAMVPEMFKFLPQAALKSLTFLVRPIFYILGIELDGIKSAHRIKELELKQIVTQHSVLELQGNIGILPHEGDIKDDGSDDIIPNKASLYVGLRKDKTFTDDKRIKFYGNSFVDHNSPSLPKEVQDHVEKEINEFMQSN